MAETLQKANSLVRKAMAALHAAERRFAQFEAVAREAIVLASDNAVEVIVEKARWREEWARREHWVRKQSTEKRGPKRKKNRVRDSAEKAVPPCATQTCQGIRLAVERVE